MSLREKLANLEHDRWSRWMKYLFTKGEFNLDGSFTIHYESTLRWLKQSETSYKELTEVEKDSDRKEADKTIELLNQNHNLWETND